jgi:hypothetical protein
MRKKAWLASICFSLLATVAVSADTVFVVPANPTPVDPVMLLIQSNSYCIFESVTQTGNLFQIHVGTCPFEPPSINVPLGNLPLGSYQYEVYAGPGTTNLLVSGSFVVVPSVPALSPAALIALCAALMGVGCLLAGRHT